MIYPMLIGASGLIASIVGAMTITSRKISDPMSPLNIAFIVSAAIAIVLNFFFTTAFLGYNLLSFSLFATTVVGVILVPVIQRITDYYTNSKYKPVQEIADSTKWGYASNTLTGIVMGMRSTGPFMLAIVIVPWSFIWHYLRSDTGPNYGNIRYSNGCNGHAQPCRDSSMY